MFQGEGRISSLTSPNRNPSPNYMLDITVTVDDDGSLLALNHLVATVSRGGAVRVYHIQGLGPSGENLTLTPELNPKTLKLSPAAGGHLSDLTCGPSLF